MNEAKAWIERARGYEQEGNYFAAAMMAARGLSFRGFGREGYLSNPEFEERYPELVQNGTPEFAGLLQLATRNVGTGMPIWQSPRENGHEAIVTSVAFSPDGAILASGSWDTSIKLWEVESGQLKHTLTGHGGPVNSVAFSPDGATLASGSFVNSIQLWEVESGQLKHTLTGHEAIVTSVAFSPDGSILASGSSDNSIQLWEAESGQLKHTLTGHGGNVTSQAFSPDGSILASGSSDNSIQLWEVESGQLKHTLTGHEAIVNRVAFSPDGSILASGSSDNSIKLWGVESGQLKHTLTGHEDTVNSVAFSPDGAILASGSWDNSIQLWEVESGQLKHTLTGHEAIVTSVAFSPDGSILASGSWDNSIQLWEVESDQLKHTLTGHEGEVWSVAFSPDGAILASGSFDDSIKLWEVETGQLKQTLTGHDGGVASVAFSPDGATLASGGFDDSIKLWEVETGQLKQTLTGHDGGVVSVAFSPDGATLASGSFDDSIKLWEVETGQLKQTLTGHDEGVASVAFSPDGATLASSSNDNNIKLWDSSLITFNLAAYLEDGWVSIDGRNMIWPNPNEEQDFQRDSAFLNVHRYSLVGILQSDRSDDEKNEALFWRYLRASNWNSAIVMARRLPAENEPADEALVSRLTESAIGDLEKGNVKLAEFKMGQLKRASEEGFLASRADEMARKSIAVIGGPRLGALDVRQSLWDTDVIRIRFLNGEPELHAKITEIASEWTNHCHLEFEAVTDGEADITVEIDPDSQSYSFLGNGSLEQEPSMNLNVSLETPHAEFQHTVLQKFGHALGLIDENQNPASRIPWDFEKVKERDGISEMELAERFGRYHSISAGTHYREFDPKSVMTDPIPNDLTEGDFEIPMNSTLSDSDKKLIGRLYPRKDEASESDSDKPVD